MESVGCEEKQKSRCPVLSLRRNQFLQTCSNPEIHRPWDQWTCVTLYRPNWRWQADICAVVEEQIHYLEIPQLHC